jgi:hypothetical protein
MKRSLPTVGSSRSQRQNGQQRHVARDAERVHARERIKLDRPLLCVAHVNQPAAASDLAAQLCAAFVREAVPVSALVTIDTPASAAEAQSAQATLLEAGAREVVLVRKPDKDVPAAVTHALAQLSAAHWVVALGNTLPQLFHPYFTVVVTGQRRALASADPLVLQAELEVTAPGDELATLLVRRLHVQWAERAAAAAGDAG